MKRHIIHLILSGALLATGLCGCSFLDVDQPDSLVKEDYWKTKEQVEASLTGVYTSLHTNITQLLEWGDARSEIYSYGTGSGANLAEFVNQDISTTNGLCSWANVYTAINWTNSFLKNARSALSEDPTISEEEMASWESEAYAIRALYYFYLVRAFQNVPVVLEAYESDTQTPYTAPSPESSVLDTIESDLKRALAHAPATFDAPEKRFGRITQNAVKAIWADVKLWRGDYAGCLSLCGELDRTYAARMLQGTEWFTIFSQGNSAESIFEYQYLNNKGVASPLYSLYYNGSSTILKSNYEYVMERLKTLYPSDDDDHELSDTVRVLDATVASTGEVLKYLINTPYSKPVSYRSSDERDANFIFYRYREILLMEAEAYAMQEQYGQAVACINQIRTATGLPAIGDASEFGEGETFFQNLLDERMAELGYEGKHWFSQVRMARNSGFDGLVVDRNATAAGFSLPTVKFQTMRARLMERESWFLPYYKTEVEKNPLLNQKTYYEGK